MRVSLFTYLTEGNKEMSTGDDALEKIMKESSKTTAKIGSFRKKTDQFYSDLIDKEKIVWAMTTLFFLCQLNQNRTDKFFF